MNNLLWGLEMTVVGMGVVFALLALLMGVLTLLGKLDRPDKPKLAMAGAAGAAVGDDASPVAAVAHRAGSPEGAGSADTGSADAGPADVDAEAPDSAEPAPPASPEPPTSSVQILTDGLTVDQASAVALAVITHAEVRRQQAAPAMRTHAPGSQIHTSRWVAVGRSAQNQSWNRR